jgi:hypothetical protein
MALDKIKFQTNLPVELALKYTEGKLCDSQFGDPQYMFSTTDDRAFFVAAKVAQKIHGLRLQPGEPIDIIKAEVDYGNGRKGIEWQIARVNAPVEEPAPAPPSAGKRAAQKFWADKVGEQQDGTFAVPVAPERVSSPPAPVVAAPTRQAQPPSNGNGSTNGNSGSAGNPNVLITDPRPKTKLEDALKTVVHAVHNANEYAKSIGYAMPQFTSEDIRTMANTLVMDGRRG